MIQTSPYTHDARALVGAKGVRSAVHARVYGRAHKAAHPQLEDSLDMHEDTEWHMISTLALSVQRSIAGGSSVGGA